MSPTCTEGSVALAAALNYAHRGFHVFPIYEPAADLNGCSCRKGQKCDAVGKHPRTPAGFKDATTDPQQITQWFSRHTDANVGIATGKKSNVIVLDIDDDNDGFETLTEVLAALGEELPDTLTGYTGRGKHFYFRAPDEFVRCRNNALGPGIDIKADGGYVVAPPSLHLSGERYEFEDPDGEIAPLPDWLRSALATEAWNETPRTQHSAVAEGNRNTTLTSRAGRLRAAGAELSEIRAALRRMNEAECNPALSHYELDSIAKSVCSYPIASAPSRSKRSPDDPLPWFRMNTIWWNANVNIDLMDGEQVGWYTRLLIKAWPRGGFLPADIESLSKIARADSEERFASKCDVVLAEFDKCKTEDGKDSLVHRMLEAAYAEAINRSEQNSKNARKRWDKEQVSE